MVNKSPLIAFISWVFIGPKSTRKRVIPINITNVSNAYKLYGIVWINTANPLIPESAGTEEVTAAAQELIGAMIHTGAAVASII